MNGNGHSVGFSVRVAVAPCESPGDVKILGGARMTKILTVQRLVSHWVLFVGRRIGRFWWPLAELNLALWLARSYSGAISATN